MPDFRRKPNRLPCFDYNTPGFYFITLCAKDRRMLFRTDAFEPLTVPGCIAETAVQAIPAIYAGVLLDKYVIMPNHIHMILGMDGSCDVSVPTIVQQTKRRASRTAGQGLWQRSYYDHVIRDEQDYLRIREYIENNPVRWTEDRYFDR